MKKLLIAYIFFLITIGCGGNHNSAEVTDEDYIDIVSVEPVEVAEGEEVTFKVSYNFRLVSTTECLVYIGFNSKEKPDKYYVEKMAKVSVLGPYEGSDSIEITTHPIYLEPTDSFNIYVNISPYHQGDIESWAPLASDTLPILVNNGSSEVDNIDEPPVECDFVECTTHD